MATYNFLRESEVYLVYGGNQYRVDVYPNISCSQTFTEESYPVKTLHNQSLMFEGSSITRANPANFEFTIPSLRENDLDVILDLLMDYDTSSGQQLIKTFDLYIKTQDSVFKLQTCVLTNGTFLIEKLRPLSVSLSGEAVKLSRVGTASGYTIPGSVQSRSGSRTYKRINYLDVSVNSTTLTSIFSTSVELQNNIEWTPYATIQDSLAVTNESNTMYPSSFSLSNRILSGSIGQYVNSDENSSLQSWSQAVPIRIRAGDNSGGTVYGFDFNMSSCVFTNRLSVANVFTQNYDWRMTQNPASLSSIFTHT